MSLEELRKGLVQEAKAEAAKIKAEAEAKAGEKLAAAKAEAAKIKADAKAKAMAMAESEKNERIGSAQLRAKKMLSESKNRVIEQALKKIWAEFEKVPGNRAAYEKLMKKLISKAEKEFGSGAITSVNSSDLAIAKKLAKNVSKETIRIAGGAVVSSADGSVSIDNSLESVFGQNEEKLRKLVYYELFGKGKTH